MRLRNVLDVPLPEELLALRVGDLPVRELTRRMLMLAGVSTLADLTEVEANALEGLEGARDDVLSELHHVLLGLALRAGPSATPADDTIELLRRTRLDRLPVGDRLIAALRTAGCNSVADVLDMGTDELTNVDNFGPQRARAMHTAIRRIAAIPTDRLRSISRPSGGAGFSLPRIDARILCAVALAGTAEEEIYGLVVGPPVRDSILMLKRWGLLVWPVPTLEELGQSEGLTRERVRQVVTRQETQLQGSGLRLPRASTLAKELMAAATERDRPRASQHLQLASPLIVPVLRTLPALARLGLVEIPEPASMPVTHEQHVFDLRP